MVYNESLANRVREALADLPDVMEKTMFSGVCFMVNGKMCICVSHDELLCRIGQKNTEEALEKNGTRDDQQQSHHEGLCICKRR